MISMRTSLLFILSAAVPTATSLLGYNDDNFKTAKEGWAHAQKVLQQRIKPPTFLSGTEHDYNIVDYGAVGDGITDCTNAFRTAIQHASGNGGRVIVPSNDGGGDIFLTGPIVLKSNVHLHISSSSTIRFKQDPSAYLPPVQTRWTGVELYNYSPLIYAYGEENIAITGGGILDGNANESTWWSWKNNGLQKAGKERLFQMAQDNVPIKQRMFGEGFYLRPNFIQFLKSKNVLMEGVTVINSPMWVIHPVYCTNVIVRNVTVDSHGPNNDGCNPDSSTDVLIENSFFDTGDDCIAVKSGRGDDGRRVNIPSVNVIVRNCTMKDGHGGLVAGSEIAAGAYNLFAEDCNWDSPNLRYGLRVKSNAMFGGFAENIFIRNIRMKQVSRAAIRVNFKYGYVEDGPQASFLRANNIFVENVTSERSQYALQLEALDKAWANNITISNSKFTNIERSNVVSYIHGLTLEDVRFEYVPYRPSATVVFGMILFLCVWIAAYILEHYIHRPILIKTRYGVVNMSKPISFAKTFLRRRFYHFSPNNRAKNDEKEGLVEIN